MNDTGYFTPKPHDHTTSSGVFKTPLPYNTPKSYDSNNDIYITPRTKPESSDSDESTASSLDNVGTGGSSDGGELSIVAEFDDLMRCVRHQRNRETEDSFLEVCERLKEMQMAWQAALQECQRLRAALDEKTQDCSDLEGKLSLARKLFDQQKRSTKKAEEEKAELVINVTCAYYSYYSYVLYVFRKIN